MATADVLAFHQTLSNWGRWGEDDQLGALNLITPEVTAAAAATGRNRRTVSRAPPRGPGAPRGDGAPRPHRVLRPPPRHRGLGGQPLPGGAPHDGDGDGGHGGRLRRPPTARCGH